MTFTQNELLELRNKELVDSYKRILKDEYAKNSVVNRRKVVDRVIHESHPHFHVSFPHAYKVLSTIRHHGSKGFRQTLRQQMWHELYLLVIDEMRRLPLLSFGNAISRVLAEKRASRFFLSHDYCYKFLYDIA